MKKLTLGLLMPITTASLGYGQRETAAQVQVELKNAKWIKMGENDADPIFINAARIEKINGVVFFRTKFLKRGTTVYASHVGNCTSDIMADAPVGWARYGTSTKLVSIEIKFEEYADENGLYKVKPDTVGWTVLECACTNPTSVNVID